MINVTCVWPLNHYYSPTLSLLYTAKVIKDQGYETSVIYSNLLFNRDNMSLPVEAAESPEHALQKIIRGVEKTHPESVFLGSWREHAPFVDKFSRQFKERNPDVILINGGHNPTFIPEKVLEQTPEIDYLIRGEPEMVLPKLLKQLKGKNLNKVPGISYKKGKHYHHTALSVVKDIDNLPYIDYEDVIGNKPARFDLRTSRGCIMKCNFCNLYKMWPRPVRFHSNKYIIQQIKHLEDLYDFDYVHFIDEMYLCKVQRARTLAREIHQTFPELKWGGMIRNEFVTEKNIDILTSSGFCNAAVGVESNNPRVLKYLNKTLDTGSYIGKISGTLDIMKNRLDVLEVGLITATPVETARDIIDLIDFIKKIKASKGKLETLRIALGKLIVYPGTRLWEDLENGKIHMTKDRGTPNKYESYLSKDLDSVWATPWKYTIDNPHIETREDYDNLLRLAYNTAEG